MSACIATTGDAHRPKWGAKQSLMSSRGGRLWANSSYSASEPGATTERIESRGQIGITRCLYSCDLARHDAIDIRMPLASSAPASVWPCANLTATYRRPPRLPRWYQRRWQRGSRWERSSPMPTSRDSRPNTSDRCWSTPRGARWTCTPIRAHRPPGIRSRWHAGRPIPLPPLRPAPGSATSAICAPPTSGPTAGSGTVARRNRWRRTSRRAAPKRRRRVGGASARRSWPTSAMRRCARMGAWSRRC
jgi:hypothetical protein